MTDPSPYWTSAEPEDNAPTEIVLRIAPGYIKRPDAARRLAIEADLLEGVMRRRYDRSSLWPLIIGELATALREHATGLEDAYDRQAAAFAAALEDPQP